MDGRTVKQLFLLCLLIVMWFGGCNILNGFSTYTEEGYGGEVYVYEDPVTSEETVAGIFIKAFLITATGWILSALDK
ncbi:hypothetical protein H6F88_31615 [Oculatella sp. FACHB-28]|uniref:hypothetical protein n=1 Tax=Oculatella sp. FACHB-28 TaxID=2692845 RepID=UPI001684ADD5|nr:hypothetical protein [Oculatella sp. FACHB-28]MBD2060491.1 hypothetical protein [Oculatella sp. FACHB-28]